MITAEATIWLKGRAGPPRFALPAASERAVTTAAAVSGTLHLRSSSSARRAATSTPNSGRYWSMGGRSQNQPKNPAYAST